MRQLSAFGLVLVAILGGVFVPAPAQEESVRLLEPAAARRFLPDRVPMEAEMIALDAAKSAVLQFPDKTRIGLAALVTAPLSAEMKQKYQYTLVGETRVKLDRWTLPAGMVGLALQGEAGTPTRILIARDFNGSELERITVKLDSSAPDNGVSLKPSGTKDFTMYIGKYAIQGSQK